MTPTTQVGEDRLRPAEANRLFYRSRADTYDENEYCVAGEEPRQRLDRILDVAVRAVGSPERALDAGGGSGNVSMRLLDLGLEPVLVDVSPEMAAIWERKARARGHEPEIEISSLEEFFDRDERSWDLIVFSSVLHHLDDPPRLVEAAGRRVAPGGAIITVFDPTAATPLRSGLRRLDYLLWVLRHSPSRLGGIIGRRARGASDSDGEENIGAIAERHSVSGIDDQRLVAEMSAKGFEPILHERNYHGRYLIVRLIARLARSPTDFALVMRRRPER